MKNVATKDFLIAAGLFLASQSAWSKTVELKLQATNAAGSPISQVSLGSDFWLNVTVQDIRPEPRGAFAAFLDVEYDPSLVSVIPDSLWHGPDFPYAPAGDVSTPPTINEAGGLGEVTVPPDGGRVSLLFKVGFHADRLGLATFTGNPADLNGHAALVYGFNFEIPNEEIAFKNSTLSVVPEPSSWVLAAAGGTSAWLGLCRSRRRQVRWSFLGAERQDLRFARRLAGKRP